MALNGNNKVYISYDLDAANKDLKLATNATGTWVISVIDSTGDVGQHTSIAIDSNNMLHVSYYDATNGDLKYATNISGSWVTYIVDSAGDVGRATSIGLDGNNKVYISYYDSTNDDLKYATNAPIDITPPVGSIKINNNATLTNSLSVALTLTCSDLQSACSQMQFSNTGSGWSSAETYASAKNWTLSVGDGSKSVYARFMDSNGNCSKPTAVRLYLMEQRRAAVWQSLAHL